jgi:hypothetical protein
LSDRIISLQLLNSWNPLPSPTISQMDIKEYKKIDELKTQMLCLSLVEVKIKFTS